MHSSRHELERIRERIRETLASPAILKKYKRTMYMHIIGFTAYACQLGITGQVLSKLASMIGFRESTDD